MLTIRVRSGSIQSMKKKGKNLHAVILGRRGGKKGGPARAAKMTPGERREAARKAVLARWAKARRSEKQQ